MSESKSIQSGLIHRGSARGWPFLSCPITPDLGLSWSPLRAGGGNSEALRRSWFLESPKMGMTWLNE